MSEASTAVVRPVGATVERGVRAGVDDGTLPDGSLLAGSLLDGVDEAGALDGVVRGTLDGTAGVVVEGRAGAVLGVVARVLGLVVGAAVVATEAVRLERLPNTAE